MNARLNTALLFAIAIAASSAQAATRCEAGNLSLPEETACAKAAQSTAALRHYVQRTRALHGLYMWDYVKREDVAAAQVERRAEAAARQDDAQQVARR